MAKRPKPSGRLSSGPWTYRDLYECLSRDGWKPVPATRHVAMVNDARPGRKIMLDKKWTSVKKGSVVFNSIADQGAYSAKQLQRLLNAS